MKLAERDYNQIHTQKRNVFNKSLGFQSIRPFINTDFTPHDKYVLFSFQLWFLKFKLK